MARTDRWQQTSACTGSKDDRSVERHTVNPPFTAPAANHPPDSRPSAWISGGCTGRSDCVARPSVTIGTAETVHSPDVGGSVAALPDVDGTVGSVAGGAVADDPSDGVPVETVSSPPEQAAVPSASTLIAANNRRCALTPLDLPRVRIARRQESAGSSCPIVRLHSATPQDEEADRRPSAAATHAVSSAATTCPAR